MKQYKPPSINSQNSLFRKLNDLMIKDLATCDIFEINNKYSHLTIKEYREFFNFVDALLTIFFKDMDNKACDKLFKLIDKHHGSEIWVLLGYDIYQPLFNWAEKHYKYPS